MKTVLSALIIFLAYTVLSGCSGHGEPVVEIALHPQKPYILYVATNEYIYKSRDEGRTWENISRGMSHSRVISLAIDPLFPSNVFAGTKGDAVYKSFNGGQNWTSRRNGLDDVTISSVVHQLVFAPGSSNHLYAATSMGVFESTDSGETWRKRMDGMKEVLMVISIALDPNQPQTAYAGTSGGMYKSVDGARTWNKVNNGLVPPDILKSSRALGVTKVQVDSHHMNTVYIATLTGLFKSIDGGASWSKIGLDLPDHMLSDLILDPTTPDVVYIGSRAGIHKSLDGGQTWQERNDGLASFNIRALSMSPLDAQTLYAGTNSDGLYRSRDGGGHWEALPLTELQHPSTPL